MIRVTVRPKTNILKSKEWKRAVKRAQQKSINPSKTELQAVSPVDTGLLRQSWEIKGSRMNLDIKNTAPYSRFPDEGTKYIKAQRFTDRALPKVTNLYERNIVREIENID